MNSNSDSLNSLHPHSLKIESISLNNYKKKPKNNKGFFRNNLLYDYQRKKGDMKYLEKYIHKYFISFYKNSKNDYNIRMIEDILNNESTHVVAEFKDYLIWGDITEFLQKSYNIQECRKYLPKIYEYYNSCSVIFPNYVTLHESKYIYKSIRKKQKVIDNQQEQEEKKEKMKKGDINLEDEQFFSSKTFNSILDQTNTSNVKLFFGLKDNKEIDADETPNNIVTKLEEAEKDAMQRKMNLMKNKRKPILDNNTDNNINENTISNSNFHNTIINGSKIYIKNKILKERNKNKNKGNVHYLSTQKKSIIQINNSNMNIKNINNNNNSGQIRINSYISKNSIKNENDISKMHIKSSISNTDTENDNNNKANSNISNNNYITFYGNKFSHLKQKSNSKILAENNYLKPHQIYIRNSGNHSNKNIKKQYINALFPTKNIISKIFLNNNNNSILKQNSFNFINKKIANNKNINNENINNININKNQCINSPSFPLSPSSVTIQTNPFRKKNNQNLNINIKESNSTRNINNNKWNEKINLKNVHDNNKIKRNEKKILLNYNSNTISTTFSASKTTKNKDKIKYIHTNKNFNYNKGELKHNKHNSNNINNYENFKTIGTNRRSNINIYNANKNNNCIYYKNNYNNNINKKNINNIMIKDIIIHKINSTSNIKKPINMNININMNNNSKNRIFFNEGSCENIIDNKIYSKSPLSIELETIKVTAKKRTIYPKPKSLNKNNNFDLGNYNNNIVNTINKNTLSNDKNYLIDSLSNQNEDINLKNGLILEELKKKKNIILPFNKEINNINININGYNAHEGCLTSRTSNNVSKKKYKGNIYQDINYYNQEFKKKVKNKNFKKNNGNNLVLKNENQPIKIKRIYDDIKSNKNNEKYETTGYFTSRKNK